MDRPFTHVPGRGLAVCIAVLSSGAAVAAPVPAGTIPDCPASGTVPVEFSRAVSASSFMTGDGREIRLAGVIGPGEDGAVADPGRIASAKSALTAALKGHRLTLAVINVPDRYQRVTALAFAGGVPVQSTMIRQGLLRFEPAGAPAACAADFSAAERDAIESRAGHWSGGEFRVRNPDQVTKSAGQFETVQGEVWRTRQVRGVAWIAFRSASSFQVSIAPAVVRALRAARLDVRRLRGKTIRVSGWVGPDVPLVMELATAAALEVINK